MARRLWLTLSVGCVGCAQAAPRLDAVQWEGGEAEVVADGEVRAEPPVPLTNQRFVLSFSAWMDASSVPAGVAVVDADEAPVDARVAFAPWEDPGTEFVVSFDLPAAEGYVLVVGAPAVGLQREPLDAEYRVRFDVAAKIPATLSGSE